MKRKVKYNDLTFIQHDDYSVSVEFEEYTDDFSFTADEATAFKLFLTESILFPTTSIEFEECEV